MAPLDATGIVAERAAQRAKYARHVRRPPAVPTTPREPKLEDVVRQIVDRYLATNLPKSMERLVARMMTQKSAEWHDERRLADGEVERRRVKWPIDRVLEIASQVTGCPVAAMLSPSRSRKHAFPRHFAMMLLRAARGLSYSVIGKLFGNRDHSTVLHAANVWEVRRNSPECKAWYTDPRVVEMLAGTKYEAPKS